MLGSLHHTVAERYRLQRRVLQARLGRDNDGHGSDNLGRARAMFGQLHLRLGSLAKLRPRLVVAAQRLDFGVAAQVGFQASKLPGQLNRKR